MRKLVYDLAKPLAYWLWLVVGIVLADGTKMTWTDFGWVASFAVLAGVNSYLIMGRYWCAEGEQPQIRWSVLMLLAGTFAGVAVNYNLIQAFTTVVLVSAGLVIIYIMMFVVGIIAEVSEPKEAQVGPY